MWKLRWIKEPRGRIEKESLGGARRAVNVSTNGSRGFFDWEEREREAMQQYKWLVITPRKFCDSFFSSLLYPRPDFPGALCYIPCLTPARAVFVQRSTVSSFNVGQCIIRGVLLRRKKNDIRDGSCWSLSVVFWVTLGERLFVRVAGRDQDQGGGTDKRGPMGWTSVHRRLGNW